MTKQEIENKIEELVKEYGRLQDLYHGDSSRSKAIEAELDRYEIMLERIGK